jgi:hypothetical protein
LKAIIFLNIFKNIDCFQTGRRLRHTCRNWTCDADWRHVQRDCQRALRISIQVSIKIVKHNFDKRFEVSRYSTCLRLLRLFLHKLNDNFNRDHIKQADYT